MDRQPACGAAPDAVPPACGGAGGESCLLNKAQGHPSIISGPSGIGEHQHSSPGLPGAGLALGPPPGRLRLVFFHSGSFPSANGAVTYQPSPKGWVYAFLQIPRAEGPEHLPRKTARTATQQLTRGRPPWGVRAREDSPPAPPQAGGSAFGVAFARGCSGLSALWYWVWAVFLGLHPRL